jgi:SAM-dependent methyltransferase
VIESNVNMISNVDFRSKYQDTNPISRFLVNGYFEGVRKLLHRIPAGELESALEIGCGEGFSTQRIREMLGEKSRFEASEFLAEQVEAARLRNPGLKVNQEDVYDLQRSPGSVDLIFFLQVLEHLEQPGKALAEISRVTRGYLIVGVPREPLWRFMNMARLKYLSDLGNTPGHIQHWSATGFRKLIEREFGEVIAVENPVPWTLLLARRRDSAEARS